MYRHTYLRPHYHTRVVGGFELETTDIEIFAGAPFFSQNCSAMPFLAVVWMLMPVCPMTASYIIVRALSHGFLTEGHPVLREAARIWGSSTTEAEIQFILSEVRQRSPLLLREGVGKWQDT